MGLKGLRTRERCWHRSRFFGSVRPQTLKSNGHYLQDACLSFPPSTSRRLQLRADRDERCPRRTVNVLVAGTFSSVHLSHLLLARSGGPLFARTNFVTHDHMYGLWAGIKRRCFDPAFKGYKHYGGRGITMHDSWQDSFSEFRNWILSNLGPRPDHHTLDRMDRNGHYIPGNLRWATIYEQNRNTAASHCPEDLHIYQDKTRGNWRVRRKIGDKLVDFGRHSTIEAAREARDKSYELYPLGSKYED